MLKRISGAVIAAVALINASIALAQGPTAEPQRRTITVVGLGRESGVPDTAQVQFVVEQSAQTASAAGNAAATSATKVIDALKTNVGEGGRVDTIGYTLNPVYRQPPPQGPAPKEPRGPEIVGYVAAHTIAVETHQIDKVGALIDAAIPAGASRIDNLVFTIENVAPLQALALRGAAADAGAQATAIADAMHVALKGVQEAATEGVARPVPQRYVGLTMRADAMKAETPIAPGEVTTEARLRVTYAIE